jgi:hypothetical protein
MGLAHSELLEHQEKYHANQCPTKEFVANAKSRIKL